MAFELTVFSHSDARWALNGNNNSVPLPPCYNMGVVLLLLRVHWFTAHHSSWRLNSGLLPVASSHLWPLIMAAQQRSFTSSQLSLLATHHGSSTVVFLPVVYLWPLMEAQQWSFTSSQLSPLATHGGSNRCPYQQPTYRQHSRVQNGPKQSILKRQAATPNENVS